MKTNSIFLYTALILTLLFQCMISTAQSPQKVSYQSVIRNANGELIRSTAIIIQISILKGSASGTLMYKERQSSITNINGLVTIEVGNGTPLTSTFSAIDWSQGPYFLKVETTVSTDARFNVSGISEILSVPYSLYAKKAEKADSVINEKDPFFNTSVAKNITAADTIRWNSSLSSYNEIDPRYAADSSFIKSGVRDWNSSLAKTIDAADTTHWGRAETDPIFNAWNKSTGIIITESQISDLDHFTTADEIDLRYAVDSSFVKSGVRDWNSSLAKTIDTADTTYWGRAETDPLFSTWNKSTGITITESQITDLDHFTNTDEIDPRYAADSSFIKSGVRDWNSSLAKTIDATDTTHWGRAETDPVFTLSAANSIIDAGSGAVITAAERSKLSGIDEGAQVNVQADWDQTTTTADDYIKNKPSFNTAVNFSGSLSGDVTGTQGATVVSAVGGVTAQNVAAGATLANAATSSNTMSTLVRRDLSGNFTASGLTITGGTPGAGKVLTSDASGNATWQTGGSSSTFKEITRSRFQLTALDGAYILNGQSLGENADITDYRNHFIAPFNGKLVKIVVKSEVAMGSTLLKMHINQNTTALETQTVDIAAANTAYTFTFTSSAVFNAGDDVELFVDPTEFVASTSSKVSFTIVWEY